VDITIHGAFTFEFCIASIISDLDLRVAHDKSLESTENKCE